MKKKTKVISGAALAVALAVVGGITLTAGAQATPAGPSSSTSTVEPAATSTDSDNLQNEVEDGTNDGETADDTGTESGTETGAENTSDDINGVAVEDGTQD